MKVIEFHPDDLFDREIHGTLSSDERARLAEHLVRCSACRLERQLRADFAAELAPQGEARDLQLFVSEAMQVVRDRQFDPPPAPEPFPNAPTPARTRSRPFLIALAATLTLGVGLALGQEGWAEEAWRAVGGRIDNAFQTLPPASAPRPPKHPATPHAAAPAQTHAEPSSARPAPIEVSAPVQPLPSEALSPSTPAQSNATTVRELEEGPALLFEQANSARHMGDALEAGVYYRDLQARFPKSAEARLALALMARMQLDRAEHAAALGGFEAYLATGDRALREEAMAGRALALAHLGRARASEQAFDELLRAYPDSSYAVLARSRLGQDSP